MKPVFYHLSRFPPKDINWSKLIPLLGPANAALARFDGVLEGMINPKVLLSPLTTHEAVLSSRIEGTQAEFVEVLEFEAGKVITYENQEEKERKEGDIFEIINYRKAIRQAERQLKKLPLSGRLIKNAHSVLLKGVRGRNKAPGQYRRSQNWIGPVGCSIEEARYVPIAVDKIADGMKNWEIYVNGKQEDMLVQLAIAHVEFEAIHPFLDGNGRLGRMLIPLFLYHQKLLNAPTFYVSEYLEANKEEYLERLLSVSRDNDWTGWCVFFLNAILKQADSNIHKAKAILALYESKKQAVIELTKSRYAIPVLDFIFDRTVFSASELVKRLNITRQTARRITNILVENKLLSVWRESSGRQPAIFAFTELLNIAEGKSVF